MENEIDENCVGVYVSTLTKFWEHFTACIDLISFIINGKDRSVSYLV